MAHDDSLEPVAPPNEVEASFFAKYEDLIGAWAYANRLIEDAKERISREQAEIAQHEDFQRHLRANAHKLQDAALLLGFDLFKRHEEVRQAKLREEVGPQQASPAIAQAPQPPAEEFSIKDYVLGEAAMAYPQPVRASEIRDKVLAMGRDIHPKTIGMSLYRWSQKGFLRREGKADWFFVEPEARPGLLEQIKKRQAGVAVALKLAS
jgi:hypothetical protein